MGDRKNLDLESEVNKFFGWCHRKHKERRVPSAGISPEAVPRKGGKKRGSRVNRNPDGFVARNRRFNNKRDSWYLVTAQNRYGRKAITRERR
jgi:hypothetical protein